MDHAVEASPPTIAVRGVSKGFGRTVLFSGLECDFRAGETVLLLGPNGAGKSTLLRLLAELGQPERGSIDRLPRGERVGYVGHHVGLYRHLTVRENLRLIAELTGVPVDSVAEIATRWALTEVLDRSLGDLSRGQQFRAALCRALLPAPRVLLLDEPTAALDDRSVEIVAHEVAGVVAAPRNGLAIIATHDVARLTDWATRVLVLADGRFMADSAATSLEAALEVYRRINR